MQVHLDKGKQYISENNPKSAVIELKNAVQLAPKNAEARYQLGLALLKNREGKSAFRELSIAANLNPENLDAQYQVATVLLFAKKFKECREKIDIILSKNADHIEALILRANLEIATGNPKAALSTALNVVSIDPEVSRGHVLLGKTQELNNDYTAAERSYKKAIKLTTDNINNYKILVAFYLRQKQPQKAEKLFNEMALAMPDSPQVLLLQAAFHETTKHYDLALEDLKKAVEIDDKDPAIKIVLGNFHRKHKQFSPAENAYLDAIKISQNSIDPRNLLASLYLDYGQLQKCEEQLKKIFTSDPENLSAKTIQARLFVRNHKVEKGLLLAEEVITSQPRNYEAYFAKAYALAMQQRNKLAISAALETIKLSPGHYKARLLLADLYFKDHAIKEAKQEAIYVLQIDKNNVQAAIILSKCLILEKDFTNALAILDKIKAVLPNEPTIYQTIGIAHLGSGQLDIALADFEKVLELSPQADMALSKVIAILLKKGQKSEARQRVIDASVNFPENVAILMLRASVDMHMKENDEAEKSLRKIISISPQLSKPYLMLASILQKIGKTDEAIKQIKGALEKQPDLNSVRMQLGTLLELRGDFQGAAREYRTILKSDKEFGPAANNLAWHLADRGGDLGEALRLALVARESSPDDPYVADTVGWVHYKRGSYDLALYQFQQALEKLAEVPTVNFHMALTMEKLDRKKDAMVSLNRAFETAKNGSEFPESDEAQKLAKLLAQK